MSLESEIELLRDALDHIARIANSARESTRGLDWISTRAIEALRGVPWNHEYLPEPKKAQSQDVKDLQKSLITLVKAFESENMTAIGFAEEVVRKNHHHLLKS